MRKRKEIQTVSWRLAFTSAVLLVLSYPPFDFGWLAWGAFLPWLFSLRACPTPGQAFLQSCWIGLIFFTGTIWWVGHVTVVGTVLLVAYLALYFGAWGWLTQRLLAISDKRLANRYWLFAALFGLPAAWCLLEYLRSVFLSGFGWNLLGHTQWNWIRLIQIADITGVYGVSFLVVLTNVALCLAFSLRSAAQRKAILGIAGLCLIAPLAYGSLCLRQNRPPLFSRSFAPSSILFRVAAVQGNIPQTQKWDEAFAEAIWKRYEQLSAHAADEKPDLIVWPETAVPGYLMDTEAAGRLPDIVRAIQVPLLAGVPVFERGKAFNSAVLFSTLGGPAQRYDKVHLVPFGEFIPLRPLFGWLENIVPIGGFSSGHRFTVFRDGFPSFSVLVCFEDLFPGLCRRFAQKGAQCLFVLTNDAWFGRSAASLQHLQASVFRAVENRVWVGRAANTGWTGFIDPYGKRLPPPGQIPRFKPGVAIGNLQISPWPTSPYTRWGDWFVFLCAGVAGFAFFPRKRRL